MWIVSTYISNYEHILLIKGLADFLLQFYGRPCKRHDYVGKEKKLHESIYGGRLSILLILMENQHTLLMKNLKYHYFDQLLCVNVSYFDDWLKEWEIHHYTKNVIENDKRQKFIKLDMYPSSSSSSSRNGTILKEKFELHRLFDEAEKEVWRLIKDCLLRFQQSEESNDMTHNNDYNHHHGDNDKHNIIMIQVVVLLIIVVWLVVRTLTRMVSLFKNMKVTMFVILELYKFYELHVKKQLQH